MLSGLNKGTIYYIKVLATSPIGTSNGAFKIGLVQDKRISPNIICERATAVPVSATTTVENFLEVNTKYTPVFNYSKSNG